jgi:hypothetical protein
MKTKRPTYAEAVKYSKVDRAHIVTAGYLGASAVKRLIAMHLVRDDRKERLISVRDAALRGPFYRRTRPSGAT